MYRYSSPSSSLRECGYKNTHVVICIPFPLYVLDIRDYIRAGIGACIEGYVDDPSVQ